MMTMMLLTLAGLAAGALNAVAGGGTFLSFPALVWAGVPPIMANATATMTALPGYLGSAWAFRRDVEAEGRLSLRWVIGLAVVGGLTGALLLLVTPSDAFTGIVPWLLLAATALFAAGPHLLRALKTTDGAALSPLIAAPAVLAVSIYGGYFNGGLGIMLLALFGLIGFTRLHGMNGLKNLLSAILSAVSVLAYAAADLIAWDAALVLALATAAGGYVGARFARRITDPRPLRYGIVCVGLVMTVVFFMA